MKAYRIVNRRDSRSLAAYLPEIGQLLPQIVKLDGTGVVLGVSGQSLESFRQDFCARRTDELAIGIALRYVLCHTGPSWLLGSCRAIAFPLPRLRKSPYTYLVSIPKGFSFRSCALQGAIS